MLILLLAVSNGQAGEIVVDAELRDAPSAPAAEVYTGVRRGLEAEESDAAVSARIRRERRQAQTRHPHG